MLVASFLQLAPEGTVSHAGSIKTLNLEAAPIASAPKLGSKPETKNITLVGFADEESMKAAEQKDARSFNVLPESVKVLEASGRDLESVKAVLVITGTVKMDPPNFRAMLSSEEMSKNVGTMFAQHEGLIIKHFLEARWGEKNRGGGCYFFESTEDIEAYLSSEFWDKAGCEGTPWEDVTYEMYKVVEN